MSEHSQRGVAAALANAWTALLAGRRIAPADPQPPTAPPDPDRRFAQAAAQAGRQRAWIDACLRDLAEGVVAVGADHRILHVNAAARRLLDGSEGLAPGRPLFALLSREPVLRALDTLLRPGAPESGPFAGATLDARTLLHGHITVVRDADGFAGYVLGLADPARDAVLLAQDNALRRQLARDLRQPLTNIRAAAETLAAYPAMASHERAAFHQAVLEDCDVLAARLAALEAQAAGRQRLRWPLADLYSQDVFNVLARQAARAGLILSMQGLPLWLRGDGRALPQALAVLVAGLARALGRDRFDLEALLSDRNVTLDVSWVGPAVPSATIDTWLDQPLEGVVAGETVRDVLERHNSEPWSQRLRNGTTVLRIPLPAPQRPQFAAEDARLPSRPEYHDLRLLRAHAATGRLGDCPLADLPLVAFDVETTGLAPEGGDALVQLGAVRLAGGRVQPATAFDRLADPGRPIPAEATRIHRITDAMVKGKPPPGIVLRQFRDYVGGDVLVAHNAAFDLSFVEAGGAFANPVLDTLLLALVAEPEGDPALAPLARRLGVTPDPHPSALGHALTTAEVLARLIPLLAARGVRTLDDAVAAQMALIGGL